MKTILFIDIGSLPQRSLVGTIIRANNPDYGVICCDVEMRHWVFIKSLTDEYFVAPRRDDRCISGSSKNVGDEP